ncbi:MAG: hypothetical protein AAB824_01915 [Patescibacteria group bacterium]
MFLSRKTAPFAVLVLLLSLVLPCGQIPTLSSDPAQKSPEEIQALNKQAEKDLIVLVKTYGSQLREDIVPIKHLKNRDKTVSFEKLDNILNNFLIDQDTATSQLDKIFDLFPSSWTLDVEVFFEDTNKPLLNTSSLNKSVWGEEVFDSEKKKFVVYIYQDALTKYKNSELLDKTIAHEIAHANDWRSNKVLNTWEKVAFFKSVANRYGAKDRYHEAWADGYLANISYDSKEETAYHQVMEYWAIITSVYISQNSKDLPEADQALVKSVLERTSPGFDQIKQKASSRQGIWAGILAKPKAEDHNISTDKNGSFVTYTITGGTITVGTK